MPFLAPTSDTMSADDQVEPVLDFLAPRAVLELSIDDPHGGPFCVDSLAWYGMAPVVDRSDVDFTGSNPRLIRQYTYTLAESLWCVIIWRKSTLLSRTLKRLPFPFQEDGHTTRSLPRPSTFSLLVAFNAPFSETSDLYFLLSSVLLRRVTLMETTLQRTYLACFSALALIVTSPGHYHLLARTMQPKTSSTSCLESRSRAKCFRRPPAPPSRHGAASKGFARTTRGRSLPPGMISLSTSMIHGRLSTTSWHDGR